jgi:hypothetical protein
MTIRFGVWCTWTRCSSSSPVTLTPNIWGRLDSNFWRRHLIWRICCRTQIFGVGTYFWQQREKHETRGCTCGNHPKCDIPCAQGNDVMCDAACSGSREAVCARRCSTLCLGENCARVGRDRRPRLVCCPLRACRFGRQLAALAARRPTVARCSRRRKTSLLPRIKFVLRATR